MRLVFLYGPPAAGKLTVARALARRTGLGLFHNHLVVDAVAAVFPFGSEPFVRLRERWWLDAFAEAARADRSLIFTFAPEPTVDPDFPTRVRALVEAQDGAVDFVALTVSSAEQDRRLTAASREEFGKLKDLAILREMRGDLAAAMAAMPTPSLTIDTEVMGPDQAAAQIAAALGLRI